TYSGLDSQPAASPDGKMIAFRSTRDGTPRIWIKQRPGGTEAALTAGPDSNPRFSPDGSTIIFTRGHGDRTVGVVYRVPVLGGDARKVVSALEADWMPDGREIVYVAADPGGGGFRSRLSRISI